MHKEPAALLIQPYMTQPHQQLFSPWTKLPLRLDHHFLPIPEGPISNVIQPSSELADISHSPSLKVSPMILERVASSVSPPSSSGHNTSTQPIDFGFDNGRGQSTDHHSPPNADNVSAADIRSAAIESEEPHETTSTVTEIGVLAITSNGHLNERVQPASPPTTTASFPTPSTEARSKPPKSKKVLFDGVVITSRSLQKHPSSISSASAIHHAPSSGPTAIPFSLVDALQFSFDANKQALLVPRPVLPKLDGDASSSAAQTDVETGTEDEQGSSTAVVPQGRLSPVRRRFARHQGPLNAATSESVVSRKRVKPISYDAVAAVVDDVLGTVVAPMRWDSDVDESESASRAGEWGGHSDAMSDALTGSLPWAEHGKGGRGRREQQSSGDRVSAPLSAFLARRSPMSSLIAATSTVSLEPTSALRPHVSMGDRFRQKLYHIFGENATVRMDRGARPHVASYENTYEGLHSEHPGASSPSPSPEEDRQEDGAQSDDDLSAQAGANTGTVLIDKFENALASDIPSIVPSLPTSRPSLKRQASQEIYADSTDYIHHAYHQNEDHSANGDDTSAVHNSLAHKKLRLDISEEQMQRWILSLQRLVKGKIRFTEEALEQLSAMLTQIDSVKKELDNNIPIVKSLREIIHQLAELHDIPFGDPYMLRKRARFMAHQWA